MKPLKRSPLKATAFTNRISSSQDRLKYRKTYANLPTILEEPQAEPDLYREAHDAFQSRDRRQAEKEDDDDDDDDDNDEMFEWDEDTLVAALMDDECVPQTLLGASCRSTL